MTSVQYVKGARSLTGLWLTLATFLAALISAQQELHPLVRLIGAIPLVLVFPGYALVRAVFVTRPIALPALVALTLGVSLSTGAIGGVVLQIVASRVSGPGWLILLGGVTVAAVIARGFRTRKRPSSVERSIHAFPRLSRTDVVFLVVAAAITLGAVGQAFLAARGSFSPDAPQLWIAPLDGSASNLELGVSNLQAAAASYRIVMTGTTHDPVTFSVDLAARQTWRTTISTNDSQGGQPLEVKLYSDATGTDPIREVRYWPPAPIGASGHHPDQAAARGPVHWVAT